MQVTAVIPTYQGFSSLERIKWLSHAIESSRPFQKIILGVEDGSEIPYDFYDSLSLELDLRKIKIVTVPKREDRLNVGDVFNHLVQYVETEYLSLCADDDWYCSEIAEAFVRMKTDADVVYFPYFVHHLNTPPPGDFGVFQVPPRFTKEMLLECNFISNSAITKKSMWDELGGRKTGTVDDWDFFLRAHRSGKSFLHYPYPMYHQRFYNTSLYRRQVAAWGWGTIKDKLRQAAYGEER